MAEPWLVGLARFAAAATVTVLAIRLLNPLARRFGWLDRPHGRKDHVTATPFIGGVAMFLAVLLTLPIMPLASETLLGFSSGFIVLLVVGVLDDFNDVHWSLRLSAQLCAALLMVCLGGMRIDSIGPAGAAGSLSLGAASVPFTLLVTIVMINAMNMVDGMDGAAGCLALASLMLLASVCALIDNGALRDRIVLFMGVTTGFLLMNLRHPRQAEAQVFLGNAGSAIIGFGLAWLVVRISQTTAAAYSTIFPLWFLALPCIDACVVVLRRMHDRRSPFHADREHLHHLLLAAGYSPTRAALAMGSWSLLLGLAALLAARAQLSASYQIVLFAALIVLHYAFTRDRTRAVQLLQLWNGGRRLRVADPDTSRWQN